MMQMNAFTHRVTRNDYFLLRILFFIIAAVVGYSAVRRSYDERLESALALGYGTGYAESRSRTITELNSNFPSAAALVLPQFESEFFVALLSSLLIGFYINRYNP